MLETTLENRLENKQEQALEDQIPFWKIVVNLGAQIPDEEWAKVPNDASLHLDHYLYGPFERV